MSFKVRIDWESLNYLPNDKILDSSKLKAFADEKINVAQKFKIIIWRCRKHCGKRRKSWLQAFSPFATMFSIGSFCKLKSQNYVGKGLKAWHFYLSGIKLQDGFEHDSGHCEWTNSWLWFACLSLDRRLSGISCWTPRGLQF